MQLRPTSLSALKSWLCGFIYIYIYIFKSIILFYSHTCYFCKHKKERIISQTVSYLLIRFFLKSFSPEALTQRKTWYHKFIINDKTKKHSFHKEKKNNVRNTSIFFLQSSLYLISESKKKSYEARKALMFQSFGKAFWENSTLPRNTKGYYFPS